MIIKFKDFTLIEKVDIIDEYKINIEDFENELSKREFWELDNWSGKIHFTDNELMKLSLFFGHLKHNKTHYTFKKIYGSFGTEKINFQGVINKRKDYDNEGNKLIGDSYFTIEGYIKVKFKNDKGERSISLKFHNLDRVIDFFTTFEDKIKFTYE